MEPKLESTSLDKKPAKQEINEELSWNILVADDDEGLRHMTELLLKTMGHKVTVVENGQLLVDELLKEGSAYDVVFSDNNMPEKKGVEALEEIRLMERFKNLPFIIATTDSTSDGSLEKRITNAGALFLPKPFDFENLKSALNRVTKDKV